MGGEIRKEEMVRVCRWKVVMLGVGVESESESEEECGEDLGFEVEADCEASKTPRLPSLSPAKMSGLSVVGWKLSE